MLATSASPLSVLIYARVSTDRSGSGRSVEEQTAECRRWAEREGWTVASVVSETGSASRYGRQRRDAWRTVTQAIADRQVDAVLL